MDVTKPIDPFWEEDASGLNSDPPEYNREPWPPSTTLALDFKQGIFYPSDSILESFMEYGRARTEGSDAYLLGSILPVCSSLVARQVWIDFGGHLYLNLFTLIVGKPGDRKSYTINLGERIAHILLNPERFLPSVLSVEGLFDEYALEEGGNPDQLCIVDDAAIVLSTWRSSCFGERVADLMLRLYDCKGIAEAFRRNKKKESQKVKRSIPETSTSLLFGATFADALFSKQKAQQGLARRFLYYLSCEPERVIEWPPQEAIRPIADKFKALLNFEGPLSLSDEARKLWNNFQRDNRARRAEVPDDRPDRAHMLATEPTHVLKIAGLFELAIAAAKEKPQNTPAISHSTLELAISHVKENLEAAEYLFRRARRIEASDQGEEILAKIRSQWSRSKNHPDTIFADRTKLTSTFCHNTARRGSLSTEELYQQILPELIRRNQAQLVQKNGKFEMYAFRADDLDPDNL